jgi:rod shape-determining protein MreC
VLSRGPGQSRFTLALLVVISISVIALDLLGVGPTGLVRDGVNGVLSPVRGVGNAIFGNHDSDEVQRLQERIDELEGNEIEAINYLAELRRLQAAIGVLPDSDIPFVPATIISRDVGNFDQTIEIDQGADAGIEVNMPVRVGDGLVGVIDSVTFNSSRIRLITDSTLNVGVRHTSGDIGIAHGQGEGQPLVVQNAFDSTTAVAEGDVFVTDGPDGSNFPPNIPVGTAIRIEAADNPLEQQVFIEPSASLDGLSHVAVLLFTPTQAGPADDDEDPAAG